MSTIPTLDVTQIPPKLKHPTIFQHFDALNAGEAFLILNDHDPKPLYYQLLGERGNIFTWDYLEDGPQWWQVKIAKKPATASSDTVGAIAAKDLRKAEVFKKMGIDFCCGGNKTIQEAAAAAGVAEAVVKVALEAVENQTQKASQDFNSWEIDFLTDYIIQVHHRYVKDASAIIDQLADKVAEHHGTNHPELFELSQKTHAFLSDMNSHLLKEEKILFPQIKLLVQKKRDHQNVTVSDGLISAAIKMMITEHEVSGEELKFFRKLTNEYLLPTDACNSYAYLFNKMKEFESDLLLHIHLENNILFPKALALEKA